MTPRERIISDVQNIADDHGVTVEDIFGKRRHAPIARARQEAFTALRWYGFSYPQIGRIFGRDHSTVIHGVRKVLGQ